MTYKITDEILDLRKRCLQDCVDRKGILDYNDYAFCDWVIDSGEYKQLREDEICFRSDLASLYIKWYYNARPKSQTNTESSEENHPLGKRTS